MKIFSSKWRWIAAAAILLLLCILRPGASRLKSRIIASMSSAIGRSVDIGSVRVRLLPRPGFDIENLTVYDAPEFGAEPMLRASEVTASLRLFSLVRGRIEIARLDLAEPSLNLVHGDTGRWNLEALLERSAQRPLAPTAKSKSEARPGFPYIEASSARINFKNGFEKKPFALTNADFSLWQDSENSWGVRLKAQPVRSDMNLNDTGILRVNGTWQRAATLRDTPMNFSVEWNGAQLGQLTKMITRADQGWRGGVELDLQLSGTPANLKLNSSVAFQDFRRYDITNGQQLRLAASCIGQYHSADHGFHDIMCNSPVGTGLITMKGDMGSPGSRRYHLVMMAENIPAAAVAALAQRIKKNLPDDLVARGVLQGSLTIDESSASNLQMDGRGEISGLQLGSVLNKAEVSSTLIPFAFTSGENSTTVRSAAYHNAAAMHVANGTRFELGPIAIALGRTVGSPASTIRGWVNRSAYAFSLTGEADVARTLRLARLLGIPALNAAADGSAQINLEMAGAWPDWSAGLRADFTPPQIIGKVKLKNVRLSVRGAIEPAEITSADLGLDTDRVKVAKLNVKAGNSSWTGSLEMPRGCGTPAACEVHFNLNADQIELAALSEWATPGSREQPWYRMLESSAPPAPSFLGSLRASGRLATEQFQTHRFTLNRASANVSLDRGKLKIADVTGDVLGGKHRGTWQLDLTTNPAICVGTGNLIGISLAEFADVVNIPGLQGAGSAGYKLSGPCIVKSDSAAAAPFWSRAEGTVQFDVADGAVPHLSLTESGSLLPFTRLSGQAQLSDAELEMKNVVLELPNAAFQVSGTASLTQTLDLKLERIPSGSAPGYAITGTLTEPRAEPIPRTEQARLKP